MHISSSRGGWHTLSPDREFSMIKYRLMLQMENNQISLQRLSEIKKWECSLKKGVSLCCSERERERNVSNFKESGWTGCWSWSHSPKTSEQLSTHAFDQTYLWLCGCFRLTGPGLTMQLCCWNRLTHQVTGGVGVPRSLFLSFSPFYNIRRELCRHTSRATAGTMARRPHVAW